MADSTRISQSTSQPLAPTRGGGKSGYAQAQDVERRAGVTNHQQGARERKALERLDAILASGEEPRTDVPRGYYINILV